MMPKPIKDLVLVKPLPPDTITDGGIIVADTVQRRKNVGIVISTGNGTPQEPMMLEKGMTVHNIKDCGNEIIVDGESYFLIHQRDILARQQTA